jgi:ABC-type taurine transport system ATPase subunit
VIDKLVVRNFKRFAEIEVELGNPVVFIGPNNSGKTSALQVLALWELGVKRWLEKRKVPNAPKERTGVAINRRDMVAIPVPSANLLWHNLRVRDVTTRGGKQDTKNIRLDVIVSGFSGAKQWECGLEFDYANEESIYCRPLRLSETKNPERMLIPDEASDIQVALLPSMSGLTANETKLEEGAINVRIGEGRTAEILRNLCFSVNQQSPEKWAMLCHQISSLFGVELEQPEYVKERGEIVMAYRERKLRMDLSSSGRGLQQTLLLLAFMYANPGAVLLLDEPDAHLEILRQRQIYDILTETANSNGNQVIAASHSEVILNEAARRDVVIAFVGSRPHRVDDRRTQVGKALREIGFEHYYQAEQTGWVLYLEGSTDIATLRAFAQRLANGDALQALERPFVHYVGNHPMDAVRHFHGVREAVPTLLGIGIFDRLDQGLPSPQGPKLLNWQKKEIENYLCYPETLEAFARAGDLEPLFGETRVRAMRAAVKEVEEALLTLGKLSPWDANCKVSDEFLDPVFVKYYAKLGLPNIMTKKNFYALAPFVPENRLDPEIREKLDAIAEIARSANAALADNAD